MRNRSYLRLCRDQHSTNSSSSDLKENFAERSQCVPEGAGANNSRLQQRPRIELADQNDLSKRRLHFRSDLVPRIYISSFNYTTQPTFRPDRIVKMQLSKAVIAILVTSSSALAVPAPHAESNTELVVPLDTRTDSVTLEKRQNQCIIEYCQVLFNQCITTCMSLANGDWYGALKYVRTLVAVQY